MTRLFARKPVQHVLDGAASPGASLKRVLGKWDLTALGVGAIIGAGIFASTGSAIAGGAEHIGAGPAIILSFVLTAATCGFAALCYAELAAMVPIAGSAYTYAYTALGELVAWIIGWDLILEYAVGNVAVAISWCVNRWKSCRTTTSRSWSGRSRMACRTRRCCSVRTISDSGVSGLRGWSSCQSPISASGTDCCPAW